MPATKQQFDERKKKLQSIKDAVEYFDGSSFEVIDEAQVHVMENFHKATMNEQRKDYVLVMGNAYVGNKKTDGEPYMAAVNYFAGDLHEWSHDLAYAMKSNRELCSMVFHAIEMYGRIV